MADRAERARERERSAMVDSWWTLRDYAKRVWDNSGEDDVLFLAGGIAFNILLAAVPFVLLIVTGFTYLLPAFFKGQVNSTAAITEFLNRLLPAHAEASVEKMLFDIMRTRSTVTVFSAIGFTWFSTRLFGSLRSVLAAVFDIETERGIIQGKLFDVEITVISTILFIASTTITTYVTLATSAGIQALSVLDLRTDVMGGMEYLLGRLLAAAFMAVMFFALYKYLPIRRVRNRAAWVGALFTTVLFELARVVFGFYVRTFNPGSVYTGTLTAIIVVVLWTYYAALIFILGGEVAQVHEMRRVRKMQREVLG